eukprot:SAG11_NODE_224_length_12103_cov_8.087054_9_plen_87_part_00
MLTVTRSNHCTVHLQGTAPAKGRFRIVSGGADKQLMLWNYAHSKSITDDVELVHAEHTGKCDFFGYELIGRIRLGPRLHLQDGCAA